MGLKTHHPLPKIFLRIAKKTLIEDEEIKIIGRRPVISRKFSPIGRNI